MSSSIPQQESFPVHLNVYDVGTVNRYIRCLRLGFYHSCVQVHGKEYMFRASDGGGTGIVSGDQQQLSWCQGLNQRRSILIGHTRLDPGRVVKAIDRLGNDYPGNSYNIFNKNCHHFSDSLCQALTGNRIPWWVNPVTLFGRLFGCILLVPEGNDGDADHGDADHEGNDGDDADHAHDNGGGDGDHNEEDDEHGRCLSDITIGSRVPDMITDEEQEL